MSKAHTRSRGDSGAVGAPVLTQTVSHGAKTTRSGAGTQDGDPRNTAADNLYRPTGGEQHYPGD